MCELWVSYGVISSPEVMDWRRLAVNDSYLVVSIYEKLTLQDVCDPLPFSHFEGYGMLKLFPSCEQYPLAEFIVKTAFEEGSIDNLSAVVVPLKSPCFSYKNLKNTRRPRRSIRPLDIVSPFWKL